MSATDDPERQSEEPIYADPYTRITWLREEIERLRRELDILTNPLSCDEERSLHAD